MKSVITLVAAAHAAVALASFVAVRGVSRTLEDIARQGGGIATFSEGMVDATRWPLIAAWIAAGVSVAALLVARRNATQDRRPVRSAALVAIAIGAGVGGVLVFRGIVTFLTHAITPPGASPAVVLGRVTSASWITALCFAAAIAVALVSLRTRATMGVAVLAVVISLGVSAAMIVTLRDLSAVHEDVLQGDLRRFRAELR